MRKEKNENFQTIIPRELFEEINVFLTEKGMTKVDFIKEAYEIINKEVKLNACADEILALL